jgi:hypothetical protein
MSFKFKIITVDLTQLTPDKSTGFFTAVQIQVLINQLITERRYIKHRITPVGEKYLNYEILIKPE